MYYCHLELTCVIHNIMRLKFQKILTLLLLSAFLATSTAGNVFGCTECAGGEWSQSVNTSVDKCCCTEDLINNPEDSHEVPALHQLGDEQQGSCSDCSTPQGSTVFSKRTKRIPTAVTTPIISNSFPQKVAASVKLVVGNLAPQPPTKTSQTLLAHRTVVLLN